MILTGKAKEDFSKFYIDNNYDLTINFKNLPEIYQNALIIGWFDSVGIYIHIEPYYYKKHLYFKQYVLEYKDISEQNTYLKRQEATEEAIKKANEIYNTK